MAPSRRQDLICRCESVKERFANSYLSTAGPGLALEFGEQFHSSIKSSTAYSFGNCSRKDAARSTSKELSSASPSPAHSPTRYDNMGGRSGQTVVERAPMCQFGTDKNGADLREYKATGITRNRRRRQLRSIRDRVHKRV